MARRKTPVAAESVPLDGVAAAAGRHPAELRGQDGKGNVRPADNRFLTEEQVEARDAYVAEVTGDDAQQLVVKREAPEHVEALTGRDRTTEG
jgi:hypothetical protein